MVSVLWGVLLLSGCPAVGVVGSVCLVVFVLVGCHLST